MRRWKWGAVFLVVLASALACGLDAVPIDADLTCDEQLGGEDVIVATSDDLDFAVRCEVELGDDQWEIHGDRVEDTDATTNYAVIEYVPDPGLCDAIANGATWTCGTYSPKR